MTFLVSPSVQLNEFDLTTTISAIAESPTAFAGVFLWGPMEQLITVDSEKTLSSIFLTPSSFNGETWFSAASYLAYGGNLIMVRAGQVTGDTFDKTFNGNVNSLACQTGNTVMQLSNTANLVVGQQLFYSNNIGLNANQNGGVTITAVNTTTVTLSSSPTANINAIEVIFRDPTVYTAIGQEIPVINLNWSQQIVKNQADYTNHVGLFDASVIYVAKYPGAAGNSLRVNQCDTATQFSSIIPLCSNATLINATSSVLVANVGSNTITMTVLPANTANSTMVLAANTTAYTAQTSLSIGDLIQVGNNSIGYQFMKTTSVGPINVVNNVYSFSVQAEEEYVLVANAVSNTLNRYWEFYNLIGTAPGQSDYMVQFGNTAASDEMHIVVVDDGGDFTGIPGTVLEVYKGVSRATDAMNNDNTSNYFKTVINAQSSKIWCCNDRTTALSATAALLSSSTAVAPLDINLIGGSDGHNEATVPLGTLTTAYNYFASAEDVDIGMIMTGKARGLPINSNTQLATWLINNIAEKRKDCIVLCSPDINLVVNNKGNEAAACVTARNTMPSSSYAVMDSGYKYMYDRYNDVYRWVPLNGDIAGLCAQTDMTNAQWWSPAGFNRGNVKNVVRLAWNPRESERDTLYPNGINPVTTFPGLGTVLFGDKTLLDKSSAFNRINVRRLFIVLEKAIATASKFTLFEFNDDFTRMQFKAMVNPFLADIQSRRGITGYLVRCDKTNNTAFVIQNNYFVADIFIRPNYSINWVKLNFVNVPPSLSFAEAEVNQF